MKKKIILVLIATRKYRQFVEPLLKGVDKYFLPNHDVDVMIFTDEKFKTDNYGRLKIHQMGIDSYGFPEATLLRYKIFDSEREFLLGYDYLFYSDVDMSFEAEIGEEIFGKLTAVRHPGFSANNGWGDMETTPESLAYTPPDFRKTYFAGGFQGGEAKTYLDAAKSLAANIDDDTKRGVLARWHDESHWNNYINIILGVEFLASTLNELSPSYCSVPSMHQRIAWGIDKLPAKIIAMDKNHAELRS